MGLSGSAEKRRLAEEMAAGPRTCGACQGSGQVTEEAAYRDQDGVQRRSPVTSPCPFCNGKGVQ